MILTNQIISAFIRNVNNPSVKKLIGRVKMMNAGFTKKLMMLKTIAASNAVQKLLTCIPGRTLADTKNTIAITSYRTKNISCLLLSCLFKEPY